MNRVHLGNQTLTLAIAHADLNGMTTEADLKIIIVLMLPVLFSFYSYTQRLWKSQRI